MTFDTYQEVYNEISKLVLYPKSNSIRNDVYSSLIQNILLDIQPHQLLSNDKIIKDIEKKFQIHNVSPPIIEDCLTQMEMLGIIKNELGGWRLTTEARTEGHNNVADVKKNYKLMFQSIFNHIQQNSSIKIDEYQHVFLQKVIEQTFFDIFDNISQTTINYIQEISEPLQLLFIRNRIIDNSEVIDKSFIENARELIQTLCDSMEDIIRNPTDEFSNGLFQIATKHVMWRVLGVDPELKKYQIELFRSSCIFLDTNVLIAAMFEGSSRNQHTIWMLDATSSVGVDLFVSDITLQEFKYAIDHADALHESFSGKKITKKVLDNEIIRTYYQTRKYPDWASFVSYMKQAPEIFIKKWNVKVLDTRKFEMNVSLKVGFSRIIKQFKNTALFDTPSAILDHDSSQILLIQMIRENKSRSFNSPWFVTHDICLRRADQEIKRRFSYPLHVTISFDTWFELIYPFLWAEINEDDASKIFIKIMASSILPIPGPSVESFVRYIAAETELPVDDEDILQRVIQTSHLRRTLEMDLQKGDMGVALDTFERILGSALELEKRLEEKDKTIGRLVDRVKTLDIAPKDLEIELEIDELMKAITTVKKAVTNQEKKEALEELATLIINSIKGFKVIGRNIRTDAEEIDHIVQNASGIPWGDPILVECKNWTDPVGKPEVVDFIDKLEFQKSSTGILIAKNGITGTDYRDAQLKIREALGNKGIRIIVISLDELEALNNGNDLKKLLLDKYYQV